MSAEQAYECKDCKGQKITSAGKAPPECCGRPMQRIPMDQCTLSATAEHSRFDTDDEPCDDGRGG